MMNEAESSGTLLKVTRNDPNARILHAIHYNIHSAFLIRVS